MPTFDVNSDASIKLTAKLERLGRFTFPNTVRNTLNEAAFRDKQLIPKTAQKKFITRNKSFFKAFTIWEKAKGDNVNRMQSRVGINSLRGSKVAKGLEKQETGGNLNNKKTTIHRDSRVSKSESKKVGSRNRFNQQTGSIHDATSAYKRRNGNKKSKFIAAMHSTIKSGSSLMLLKRGSKGVVYKFNGSKSSLKTKGTKLKLQKLYNYRDNPNTNVKRTNFMRDSANIIQKQIPNIYRKKAEFQFNKALK
tara:strand:- start:14 stop:763 length:750 start_codon:yes stop_codon:yes gene_type:complete